jgi:hypothetical protein
VDLDPGTASFLVNLGKAEYVTEKPAAATPQASAQVAAKVEDPPEEEPQIEDEPPSPRRRKTTK